MPCQLPADCLNEIFEYLEKDKITLYSCLLVNHLWCEISVRILWRHIVNCNFKILNTLITCLPDESKDLLHKFILTPISKPPLFNYASFCKALSIDQIARNWFENPFKLRNFRIDYNNENLIIQEIFKMLMNQTSLKKLKYPFKRIKLFDSVVEIPNFIQFPGAKDCLTGLSKLSCSSNVYSEFCYQLSQICHNIQSIDVEFDDRIPNALNHLISSQNSLKSLSLILLSIRMDIVPSLLMGCLNTLIKLKIRIKNGGSCRFNELKDVTFSQLQILKIDGFLTEDFIKFLEINGKNLKELYVKLGDYSINLAIAKFCPNLKSLYTRFFYGEDGLETLKIIFHSCEQLEKIKVRCGESFLTEEQIFEIVANHSPKNFHELELFSCQPRLLSKELESFFISWKNRIPLSFIVVESLNSLYKNNENMKIIEKYKKLGTIKKFGIEKNKMHL